MTDTTMKPADPMATTPVSVSDAPAAPAVTEAPVAPMVSASTVAARPMAEMTPPAAPVADEIKGSGPTTPPTPGV